MCLFDRIHAPSAHAHTRTIVYCHLVGNRPTDIFLDGVVDETNLTQIEPTEFSRISLPPFSFPYKFLLWIAILQITILR